MPWRIVRAARERPARVVSRRSRLCFGSIGLRSTFIGDAGQPARPGSLGNFHYMTSYDSWAGAHRSAITPRDNPHTEFASGAPIINHPLRHRHEDLLRRRALTPGNTALMRKLPLAAVLS